VITDSNIYGYFLQKTTTNKQILNALKGVNYEIDCCVLGRHLYDTGIMVPYFITTLK